MAENRGFSPVLNQIKDSIMILTKEKLLFHFETVCRDRISTLIEDSGRGINCNCNIEVDSCEECSFWAEGVRNYQLYLDDIKETKESNNSDCQKCAEEEYESKKFWGEETE